MRFPALLRYIELAQPKAVVLNHGWRDFVWHLRRLGVGAALSALETGHD